MDKLRKFLALPTEEKRIFMLAVILLPLLTVALRVLGYQRLRNFLKGSPRASRKPITMDKLIALGGVVNSASNYAPARITCLTRSLLLYWLLQRRGAKTQLRIGVNLVHGKPDAHAWVEHEGVPINDAQDVAQHFAPFEEPISPESFT